MMDVLVTWKDGTQNVVSTRELLPINKRDKITLGTKVKMWYGQRWWYGTVTVIEALESSSSEDEPLSSYVLKEHAKNCYEYVNCYNPILTTCAECTAFLCTEHYENGASCSNHVVQKSTPEIAHDCSFSNLEQNLFDTRIEDTFTSTRHEYQKLCEYSICTEEVFSACHRCSCLLCYNHFINDCSNCEHHQNLKPGMIITNTAIFEPKQYDIEQTCEFANCTNPILTTCFECSCLLCDIHFETKSCADHATNKSQFIHPSADLGIHMEDVDSDATVVLSDSRDPSPSIIRQYEQQQGSLVPEDFVVDGAPREREISKPVRKNKYKEAKFLRHSGKEYISPYTKKVVSGKKVGSSCNLENCTKQNMYCYRFDENDRENIFMDFYSLANLTLQREYITWFVEKKPVARKTTATESRRHFTNCFYLPLNGNREKVCKTMFLHTLGISEKTFRTSISKLQPTGILEKEKRGGRQEVYRERDTQMRALIAEHINRFPRVESHYCRKDSKKEYLHHDLTLKKMYNMFLQEYNETVSVTLYRNVFQSMNLSFHSPKKDQCSLCNTYWEGTSEVKEKLQERYDRHIKEKEEIRRIKKECKIRATQNANISCCVSFDLQQVIYLPQCKESAIFYKRRLANYNFTIYDLNSKDCVCNLWNETISKRGANEMSTSVHYFLTNCDRRGVKEVCMFSDGCVGQNKNSTMAAMLLYVISNSESIEEISLRYFCSFHGQSEGDSVHSAIAFAMNQVGNIYVPSQLEPIIRLARKKPYEARLLDYDNFRHFKDLASKLKLLQLKKGDDQTGESFKWTDVMEFRVLRTQPTTLFFKTSHMETQYKSISLKRSYVHWLRTNVEQLNHSLKKNPKRSIMT